MRAPGIRGIGRTAAFVALAAALAGTAFHVAPDGKILTDHSAAAAAGPQDPFAPELARCRAIGMSAKDDAACAAAWAESRRRFFDYSPLPPEQASR